MFPEVLKRVGEQLSNALPFVVYRKPNRKEIHAILQKDDVVHHTSDFSEKGFVFAPFAKQSPVILLPYDEQLTAPIPSDNPFVMGGLDTLESVAQDKEYHLLLVARGIQEIHKGGLDKVVLSRKMEVDCPSAPLEVFQRLLATYDTAFCYLWYHPKVGMWLGATPEILLRTSNNSLTTMSLAGTKPFVEGVRPTWGKKELEEQRLVTDYILRALQDKVSNIRESEVESSQAGNLWHLRTRITAVYKDNLRAIIEALHPTPAVCGMPLQPAQRFIAENEQYDREYYTGFLGELNLRQEISRAKSERNQENKSYKVIKTATELFVNLRCMKLTDSKATVFIGGGITRDSDPEKEWQETVAKSNTILRVINP
ncbi:chorismate-binding protein [Maribacter sp. ANRC-HE7]|uniref:Chorismate-binding protein n=1 Tax=Maribacter aquimaris TaxID=2737171 RepID=A0ABR7UZI1_9FLAO|nr:chorismate-binding protein [Maribacter aquimaris]MBD0777701.1 chorismate-binding protein [Maribacter aquimaris]